MSAVLSGTAKASGQPLNLSINATMYLLPDKVLGYGPDKSRLTLAKGYGECLSPGQGVLFLELT